MSGHQKPQEQALYDYDETERLNEDASFQFPQPSPFADQIPLARAQQPHGMPIPVSAPYATSFLAYPPRDAGAQGNPYIPQRLHPLPVVISHSALTGTHGSTFRVRIQTTYELSTSFVFMMFGPTRRPAFLKREQPDALCQYYTLESEIPAFDSMQSPDTQIPLYVQFQDDYGNSLGTVEVGDFKYSDMPAYSNESYRPLASRKRKPSVDSADLMRSPPKRSASQQLIDRMRAPSVSHHQSVVPQAASPYLRSVSSAPYGLQQQIPPHHGYISQGASNGPAQHGLIQYSPHQHAPSSSLASPMYGPASRQSPLQATAGAPTMAIGHPSSLSTSTPTLVRTSSNAPPVSQPTPGSSTPAFNPYAMYPNAKAVLKLDGDLDKMAEDWTQDEWDVKRRLVQFKRKQSGSAITASFEPTTLEDRTPGSICISCIWWEEKNECFVTSVDTIYLLESLVAVKFTVEEKNRIRRNLEGFRPLTVSKAKADSEEFFKVIMGFPNPKPRNIEKDVKVFPWKILSHALKKIIGKYSASYASTASALPPPVTSGYTSRTHNISHSASEGASEQADLDSPVSASSSGVSNYRGRSLTTTVRSPGWAGVTSRTSSIDIRGSSAIQSTGQMRAQDYLGLEMPPALPGSAPSDWSQQYAAVGTGRHSLDMSAYMSEGNAAMSATPGSAQGLHQYYRTYSQPMPSVAQDPNQAICTDVYDLYGGQPAVSGSHQQTSSA